MAKRAVAILPLAILLVLTLAELSWAAEIKIIPVNPVMILPFVLLLLSIALVPFISAHWWEKYYPAVSVCLGALAVIYYFFFLDNAPRMLHTGLEYVSFIALIGSLYVVSGGIFVGIRGRSTPLANTILLAIGAVIANLLGTTGASMVLIRPYIRMNKYRISGYHIIFFIFIVSNIGGLLTPIGDPPLFLGYLKGIPFFWILGKTWTIWLLTTLIVLTVFYFLDRHHFHKLPPKLAHEVEEAPEDPLIDGALNAIFLMVILGAVFLAEPIREIIMVASATASYLTTKRQVHEKNNFSFGPIKEVAILFLGIFATMVPALDWLELNAAKLGLSAPAHFYWVVGGLSSFLDNAPAYLNLLSAAFGLHGLNLDNVSHMRVMLGQLTPGELAGIQVMATAAAPLTPELWKYVQAISAGAVLFGANTYIGNGPNFMVKSIAEQSHVKMPSFIGYMVKYSIPVLIPAYALIWLIFFR